MTLLVGSLLGAVGLTVLVWVVLRRTPQSDPPRKYWACKAVVKTTATVCKSCGRSVTVPHA